MTERKRPHSRALAGLLFCLCAAAAIADPDLTVTSPATGDFVGSSTSIGFNVRNAFLQVTVRATMTAQVGGATTTLEQRVTPNASDHTATGTLTWSPSASFPEGDYDIVVTATEVGHTYDPVTVTVTLDRLKPRLAEYSPLTNSAINGPITISAQIDEPNIDEWRVTVNDADLPNNTGSTNLVSVLWDPTNIEQDGAQTIKIVVKDKARNEFTQTLTVTLDRNAPILNIGFPAANTAIRPGSNLTVLISVVDASATSVDPLAVVVEIRDINNNFIRRIPRLRYDAAGANTARWVGRWKAILSPGITEFKIVVSAVDKAGNAAVTQEVRVRFGR
jgi:hypothetical protein